MRMLPEYGPSWPFSLCLLSTKGDWRCICIQRIKAGLSVVLGLCVPQVLKVPTKK